MVKKRKATGWNAESELPILGELTDCRQISNDCWQGTDVDGTALLPNTPFPHLRSERPAIGGQAAHPGRAQRYA